MSGLEDGLNEARRLGARFKHPDGWEPGVEWNGSFGRITAPTDNSLPDWRSLLQMWDFDPDQYEILEPVQIRTWDAAIGNGEVRKLWYHRANIRRRLVGAPDVKELMAEVRRHRPRKRPTAAGATRGYVYVASDWQIGKKGTAATTERILESFSQSVHRVRELRRVGRVLDRFYFLSLGDLVEGCKDHYPMQTFEVELDKRSQVRLARRLVMQGVQEHAQEFAEGVLAGVGGNHGENRHKGAAYTTFADNADVEVIEGAAEVLAAAPAYQHVHALIPEEQLTLTLDIYGAIVALAHGHQAKSGPTPQAKVREWWKGQAFGMRPAGDASILLTGHNHHLSIAQDGPRTHIQAPTIDSGSQWWEESAGIPSIPSGISLTIGAAGWSDLHVFGGSPMT